MNTVVRAIRLVPVRFLLLAAVGCVAAFWFTMSVAWEPTANDFYASPHSLADRLVSVQGMIAFVVAGVPVLALRWPVVAGVIGLLPFLFFVVIPFTDDWPFGIYVAVLVAAMVGMWERPRQGLAVGVLALLPVAHCTMTWSTMLLPDNYEIRAWDGPDVAVLAAYAVATAFLLGLAWWMRTSALASRRAAGLEARAAEVERTSAVVEERARLARDLHDVVAHHVSLIAVRAETAPYTHPDLTNDARSVLTDIAADARLALDELRGVLGILGRAEEGDRAPQPTWGDIPALVERTRAAGVEVSLEGTSDADVAAGPGYAAYRVVQEALTNARKHAAGQPVAVRVAATGALVEVRVETPYDGAPVGAGHGLEGMRERVEAFAGRLDAGPVGDRFVIAATLPQGSR